MRVPYPFDGSTVCNTVVLVLVLVCEDVEERVEVQAGEGTVGAQRGCLVPDVETAVDEVAVCFDACYS